MTAINKSKKPLPRRRPSDPSSPLAQWQPEMRKPKPIALPKAAGELDKPLFVFIDDDAGFLRQLENLWHSSYSSVLRLHTVNSKQQKLKDWFDKLRKDCEFKDVPSDIPSVLFIDRHMSAGMSGADLLRLIDSDERTRYLPTVLVATNSNDSYSQSAAPLEQQARLSLIDKAANIYFLNEAVNAYYYSRSLSQDTVWIDLIKKTNEAIAEQQDEQQLLEAGLSFLQRHLRLSKVFLRHLRNDELNCLYPRDDIEPKLKLSDLKKVPLLQQLLRLKQPVTQLVNRLNEEQVGKSGTAFKNHRLLAAALVYKKQRLGMLVLLRSDKQESFREKDEFFISQLAAILGAYLGSRSEEQELRERQTQLLNFLEQVGEQSNDGAVCELLGGYLHEQVNGDSDAAKTSVRQLDYLSGELNQVYLRSPPGAVNHAISVGSTNAAYAQAVREQQPVLIEDMNDSDMYLRTTEGMCSELVVPLASDGVCLGAASMENPEAGFYTQAEQDFAAALARSAAQVLLLRRARDFQRGLLQLTGGLFSAESEQLLLSCFSLLYDFSGCAALLHFSPRTEDDSAPWRVQSYVREDETVKLDQAASASWQARVDKNWHDMYAYTCLQDFLDNPSGKLLAYSADLEEIFDDGSIKISGANMETRSEALLYIADRDNQLLAMIVLLYRLPCALSEVQREQLKLFAAFLGPLLGGQAQVRWLQEQRAFDQRMALLGTAYSQLRHVMVNKLSASVDTLNPNFELNSSEKKLLIRELQELETAVENVGVLIRQPQMQRVNLAELSRWLREQFQLRAQQLAVELQASIKIERWHTDKDIVSHILYNLIDNALQAFDRWSDRPADNSSSFIKLDIYEHDNGLRLRISDNGPGISASVRERLFDFGISSKGSAGFGLYFARERARDLGGDLRYLHQHGPGTAFEFQLPTDLDHISRTTNDR